MNKNPDENSINKKRDPSRTIEVLFKISEAVSSTRNLDELYKVIHESLSKILNVDNFYIALHNQEKDSLTFPYHADERVKLPVEITNFSTIPSSAWNVISNKKPMILYGEDIVRLIDRKKEKGLNINSKIWLGVPLTVNHRVIGVIVIQSYQSESAYDEQDLELLNSVSQHIVLAIERKEYENTLAEQSIILEKILESSPVGIALVQNRVFKWVNNEMVRMFGYKSKQDVENKSVRMIYSNQEDYTKAGEIIYESLTTTGTVDYDIDLIKKDKTLFPAHLRLNSADISNPMAWTIATFTDISQRKAVEEEKVEMERLQGVLELAGAVCHEINQPLQAIMGFSELLLVASESEKVKENNIKAIKDQAYRLGTVTRKLSNITRYRTKEYPGNTKIVDIWDASSDSEYI